MENTNQKIFDSEVVEYLKSLNISDKEIAKLQFFAAKDIVLKTLKSVQDLIEDNDFKGIDQFTAFSPAGDGYGSDNAYIAFHIGSKSLDIQEVSEYLEELRSQM